MIYFLFDDTLESVSPVLFLDDCTEESLPSRVTIAEGNLIFTEDSRTSTEQRTIYQLPSYLFGFGLSFYYSFKGFFEFHLKINQTTYSLSFQRDGNIVLYKHGNNTQVLWTSNFYPLATSTGTWVGRMDLNADGFLNIAGQSDTQSFNERVRLELFVPLVSKIEVSLRLFNNSQLKYLQVTKL